MERNIVEIKNEYTIFLTNLITPGIYDGLKSVYSFALGIHKDTVEKGKNDPSSISPGVLKIFQTCLKQVPYLDSTAIEADATRIKNDSKCAEWFDDLIKAVIKSNITLLVFTNKKKQSDILKEEYHNKI